MNLMMIPCYGLLELLDLTEMKVKRVIDKTCGWNIVCANMGNDNDADDKKKVIKSTQ
jgi:hypothetical protein